MGLLLIFSVEEHFLGWVGGGGQWIIPGRFTPWELEGQGSVSTAFQGLLKCERLGDTKPIFGISKIQKGRLQKRKLRCYLVNAFRLNY